MDKPDEPGKSRDNHKKKKRRNWNWKMQTKTLNAFGQLAKCSFIRGQQMLRKFSGPRIGPVRISFRSF